MPRPHAGAVAELATKVAEVSVKEAIPDDGDYDVDEAGIMKAYEELVAKDARWGTLLPLPLGANMILPMHIACRTERIRLFMICKCRCRWCGFSPTSSVCMCYMFCTALHVHAASA